MNSKRRREIIADIVKSQDVSTQEELTYLLSQRGYSCTQATISRDIKVLNLIKVKGKNGTKYALVNRGVEDGQNEKVLILLRTFVVSIKRAQNLVVIKTLSGNGSSCGMAIDSMNLSGVVGSIAGDDTLLVIVESETKAIEIVRKLNEFVGL